MDIFVGSLPFKLKENQLKMLFEQYGEVTSAKIVIDRISRQNKGFGFVEMPDDAQAMKAIEELNGFEVEGRAIEVSKSVKKEKVTVNRSLGDGGRKPGFKSFKKESGKRSFNKEGKSNDNKGSYFKGIRGKRKS